MWAAALAGARSTARRCAEQAEGGPRGRAGAAPGARRRARRGLSRGRHARARASRGRARCGRRRSGRGHRARSATPTGSGRRSGSTTSPATSCSARSAAVPTRPSAPGTSVRWVVDSHVRRVPGRRRERRGRRRWPAARPSRQAIGTLRRAPGADACSNQPTVSLRPVRIPSDMPAQPRARRKRRIGHKGRIILIAAVALVFILFLSARGIAGFWTDYLWYDALGFGGVFRNLLVSRRRARRDLHAALRHAAVRQPLGGRSLGAAGPRARPGGAVPRALPGHAPRPAGVVRPHRRQPPVRADRRRACRRPVARLDPVHEPRQLRSQGSAVRRRHRLLRLPAAVPLASSSTGCSRRW